MEEMRLQKYLSQAWICSRRKAEEYIDKWLVSVNWEIAQIWQKINPEIDKVELLEQAVKIQNNFVYYKLNKPRGIVTTCAQHEENAIIDIIDVPERVFPIWRLDKDTTWLILLTNDWRLANFLMHPKYNHEKQYLVSTFGPIDDKAIEDLKRPMYILWSYTKWARVERVSSWTVKITITEGKNRQIRRMIERVWYDVKTLKRIKIENIELANLAPWEYVHLSKKEKNNLFKRLWIKA